ncbi:SPFH domain-containing protein [Nitratifractor sp.]|uniref:prohibitin family protein n=1 Tax=Nitratifractor sp. TaxID=2268144 RepID=UPI0025ECF4D3|nr:SPFH domain-containing protein [Nitratifractor sp.]
MPADMNDYFKKRKPSTPEPDSNGSGNDNGGIDYESPFGGNNNKALAVVVVLVVLVLGFFVLKPYTIINSGEVGIKVVTGKFSEKPLKPGLHFYLPFFEKIIPVNTRVRMITYSNTEKNEIGDTGYRGFEGGLRHNPAIQVLDKRGLTVYIDLAVQYRLRPESAPQTIEKWGTSWEEKIINSKVREVVRDVIGRYPAEQLPEMRNEIAKAIQTKIKEAIDSLPGKPVILTSVELRTIDLPKKIKEQIERVQIAKQEVTIAEQMKEKAKQDALRKAEIARGEAQKKRIEAQGEADKISIEAGAQAKANKLISQSLTPALLRLEQIKTQKAFNEALRVNKDAKIFLTPGGAVPNIWVDTKGREQKTVSTQQ